MALRAHGYIVRSGQLVRSSDRRSRDARRLITLRKNAEHGFRGHRSDAGGNGDGTVANQSRRYVRVTLGSMSRRLLIAAIIAISLGGPIAELFDRWDQALENGTDTEANVVVVALCVGVAFAIGTAVVADQIRALSSTSAGRSISAHITVRREASVLSPAPTSSPPTVLRV